MNGENGRTCIDMTVSLFSGSRSFASDMASHSVPDAVCIPAIKYLGNPQHSSGTFAKRFL